MIDGRSSTGIQCPIGLFDAHQGRIGTLVAGINAAPTTAEKTPYAQDLMDEVAVLLACVSYDAANRNCNLCRGFSRLRHQTATLIVQADRVPAPTRRQFANRNRS